MEGQPGLHDALKQLRMLRRDIRVHLRSIDADARFVAELAQLYPSFPVVANLRNGAWYVPPELARGGTAYFKSTDGHSGQWNFSLGRLNLHVARCAAEHGGVLIVDSTRSGKAFPDSLSVTVPIWCAVINRIMGFHDDDEAGSHTTRRHYRHGSHHHQCKCNPSTGPVSEGMGACGVRLPPWLSQSEQSQIAARIDAWAQSVAAIGAPQGESPPRPPGAAAAGTQVPSGLEGKEGKDGGEGAGGGSSAEVAPAAGPTGAYANCAVAQALHGILTKPLRPIWIGQERAHWDSARRRFAPDRTPLPFEHGDEQDEGARSGGDHRAASTQRWEELPFLPVVCASASDPRPADQCRASYTFAYVAGAADDEEHWACMDVPAGTTDDIDTDARSSDACCGGGGNGSDALRTRTRLPPHKRSLRVTMTAADFWRHRDDIMSLASLADGRGRDNSDGVGSASASAQFAVMMMRHWCAGHTSAAAVDSGLFLTGCGDEADTNAHANVDYGNAIVRLAPGLVLAPAGVLLQAVRRGPTVTNRATSPASPWHCLGFPFDSVLNCAPWASAVYQSAAGTEIHVDADVGATAGVNADALAIATARLAHSNGDKSCAPLDDAQWYKALPLAHGKRAFRRSGGGSGTGGFWQTDVIPTALNFVAAQHQLGRTVALVLEAENAGDAHEAPSRGTCARMWSGTAAECAVAVATAILLALYEEPSTHITQRHPVSEAAWELPLRRIVFSADMQRRAGVTKEQIRCMQARLQLAVPLACPPRRLMKQLSIFFAALPDGRDAYGWSQWLRSQTQSQPPAPPQALETRPAVVAQGQNRKDS